MHRVIGILSIPLFAITVICAGCSGTHSALNSAVAQPSQSTDTGWPTTLPIDGAQPWEVLDAAGCVVPLSRQASAVGAGSEFAAGVERYASSVAGVSDNGEACRLTSGDTGSGEVSWAWWRLTMGGQQPGVVSTDVNLLPMSDGGLSAYYLGLGDYAAGQWQWRGPFSGSHVRLSTAADVAAGSDFLSPLGNLFICVVACSGATFDVVGVAANPLDGADTQAPPVPAGLTATAIADGLQLGWQEVIAGDLAGYRVYFLDNWFHDQQGTGVRQRTFLEGRSGCLLSGLVGETFVRVSAVDLSGNESALSELVIAVPLAGEMPEVTLTASAPSGMLSEGISLSAAGAESYDWDLDGDGTYDVTGDTTGTAEADTSATGIIRPAVRGMNDGGSAVALGAVSLLVAGNARPVASAYADPSYGPATLAVTFTGEASDPDGEIVLYSWDFTGDGTYDWSDPVDTTPPVQYYGTPHLYNVKLRVDDDQGAFDVDTVTVLIEPAVDDNLPPVARLTTAVDGVNPGEQLTLFASDSSDPDGMIVDYEWDLNSNGVFNETGNDEEDARGYTVAHVRRSNPGLHTVALRVTDDDGASDTVEFVFVVHGWVIRTVIDDDVWRFIDMEIVSGHPAISFYFESFTSEDLRYVRADDDLGLTWGSEVLVDSDWQTDSGWNSNLEVVNGYPAIAYRVQESSGDWNLKYAGRGCQRRQLGRSGICRQRRRHHVLRRHGGRCRKPGHLLQHVFPRQAELRPGCGFPRHQLGVVDHR